MAQEMLTRNSCEFCGREHDLAKRENCQAFGRSCNKCGKKNHFASVCFGHAPKPTTRMHPVYIVSKMSFQTKFLEWKECNVG